MERARLLGLDIGDRRIGVAMSDPLWLTAQPLTVLERRAPAEDVDAIRALVEAHGVARVIVGWPLTLRGEPGPQAKKVEAFVQELRGRLSIPIELLDERFTTLQGQRVLAEAGVSRRTRKQAIDQIAAQLILQHFLDSHRP